MSPSLSHASKESKPRQYDTRPLGPSDCARLRRLSPLCLHINGFRTFIHSSDNSAAFCSTVLCRRLSLSYLFYYNLRLLLLPTTSLTTIR